MDEREYQENTKSSLKLIYNDVLVQWKPFIGYGREIYAPSIDIAVGPFAIGDIRYEQKYSEILDNTKSFINLLIEKHNENVEQIEEQTSFENIKNFNINARCLFCIEIEETGSRKHIIGDLVNASCLGRIGLLIARSDEVFKAFLRQRVYLNYLKSVGKNTFQIDNAIILTEDQFDKCLADFNSKNLPSGHNIKMGVI